MAGDNWIQGAIKHRGSLHKSLGVPEGQKIPKSKIAKAANSSNPKLAKRARLAETLASFHHAEGGKVVGDVDGHAAKKRMDRPARHSRGL